MRRSGVHRPWPASSLGAAEVAQAVQAAGVTTDHLLNDGALTEDDKASQLLALADRLGLARQPAPQPLPPIEPDDIPPPDLLDPVILPGCDCDF